MTREILCCRACGRALPQGVEIRLCLHCIIANAPFQELRERVSAGLLSDFNGLNHRERLHNGRPYATVDEYLHVLNLRLREEDL